MTHIDIEVIKEIAAEASQKIMKVYQSGDFDVETKKDDSPLTRADKLSHNWIVEQLEKAYPNIPVISEESKSISFEKRKNFESFWLVDPLDGTKDFIKKNGEFTVNIALIHKSRSVLGVIHVPVSGAMYWGQKGEKSYKSSSSKTVELNCLPFHIEQENLCVVCSRSHLNEKTKNFIEKLNNPQSISVGSSLKFMMLTEGKAHLYPRLSPIMEWDIAAADAILSGAKGKILQNNQPIMYNQEIMKIHSFIAYGDIYTVSDSSQSPKP